MSKKQQNFRLSAASRKHLAELSASLQWSGTRVIEEALLDLWRKTFQSIEDDWRERHTGPGPVPKPPAEVAGGAATSGSDEFREGSGSVKRALGGVKRVQAIPKPGWKK